MISSPDLPAVMLALAMQNGASGMWSVLGELSAWLVDGYRKQPMIMIGLAGLLVIPALAVLGAAIRVVPRFLSSAAEPTRPVIAAAAPTAGWILLEGRSTDPVQLDRELTQIGRQDDNDVCIDDASVHRYHAVIERDRVAGFIISDMSGPEGNGMRINGARRTTWTLAHGDVVELGRARLRFATTV